MKTDLTITTIFLVLGFLGLAYATIVAISNLF